MSSSHALGNGSIIGGCSRYQSRSHNDGSCDSTDSTVFLRSLLDNKIKGLNLTFGVVV